MLKKNLMWQRLGLSTLGIAWTVNLAMCSSLAWVKSRFIMNFKKCLNGLYFDPLFILWHNCQPVSSNGKLMWIAGTDPLSILRLLKYDPCYLGLLKYSPCQSTPGNPHQFSIAGNSHTLIGVKWSVGQIIGVSVKFMPLSEWAKIRP